MAITNRKSWILSGALLLAFSLQPLLNAVAVPLNIREIIQKKVHQNQTPAPEDRSHISPWVIPPSADLNKFKLLLVIGQDEELSSSPIQLFTTYGFNP